MRKKIEVLLSIIIVIFFGILAGFPLLHSGLPPTHDGEYHVVRFFLFNESFTDGNLYPRWAAHLNNGFGVPLFTFVYPLPNYIAVFLHLFSISFIDAFRLEMFGAVLVGAIFFYLWAKEFWGKFGGIVSSVFYTFSPYHFVDIYIRGSIGEVWALAFFPAFLWAYTLFMKSNKKTLYFILSSVFFALIIFSHNILSLMFFGFVSSYIVFTLFLNKVKLKMVIGSFCILLTGLGVTTIFWLPAIYETNLTVGLQIFDVFDHFPDLYELLIPSWGSGFSGAGLQNELSPQIGIANIMAVFVGIIVILFQIKNKDKRSFYTLFFLGWFILVLLLMLDISWPIWQIILPMKYFQFPWRLLSIEILFASFLAGSIFSLKVNRWLKTFFAIFLIFITFILGIGYARPAYYHYRNDNYYISRSNFIDGTNSPGNVFNTIYLNAIPEKKKQKVEFLRGGGKIALNKVKSNAYEFEVNANKKSEILMNIAYFPGWNVYVNDKKTSITLTSNGRFTFQVSEGKSVIRVIFEETLLRKIAAFTSLISIIFIIVLFMRKRFVTINK